MSDQIARSALSRMNLREQAVAPHYQGFAADMMQMASIDPIEAQEKFMNQQRGELCEAYGFGKPSQSKPFAFANGFAIIPIHGTLINRFGQCYGYVTGYNFIRAQHNAAMLDDDVKYIVHDHNSYGGEAAGCFELADDIFNSRGKKPIVAVVDSNAYSASFALASAADKIIVTPSSGVGSIGVVAMHVDMSKMLDRIGVAVTFIHSGDHKVDGNPYEALPPEVKAGIQKSVDKSRAKFVALVARNLGVAEKIVHNTEANTFRAEEALDLGLIHAIAVPSAAMQSIIDDESNANDESDIQLSTSKELDMNTAATAATTAAAAAPVVAPVVAAAAPVVAGPTAQQAERERIGGILNCEEAKGKTTLANHLAMNTEMSLADAKGMLAMAGMDAAAAPVAAAAPANAFEQAMNNTAHPNVGADGEGASGEQPKHLAILVDFQRATGQKVLEN